MSSTKPKTRTGADKPKETEHLSEAEKRALDTQSEIEKANGAEREKLTRKVSSGK